MLSLVAAVKAPRTHNRRGMTGSSGRRREGKESEQQRPNMSRHVFASAVLLLLVVMVCCGSGGAATADDGKQSSPGSSSVTYFYWRDTKEGETVSSLRVPSLVGMDGEVFAVTEAQCKRGSDCGFDGVASKLLKLTDQKPKEVLDPTQLKTQVLEKSGSSDGSCPSNEVKGDNSLPTTKLHVGGPTTVVRGRDIYMLAGNYSWTYASTGQAANVLWGLILVKGEVSSEGSGKRIHWNDTYALPWDHFFGETKGSLMRLMGGGGSGVGTEGNTLVFPVEGTKKKENGGTEEDGKTVSLLIYSSDTVSWTLSKGMSADGCSDPSVVERKKGKLIMMTACDDGRRRVYEINDKGDSWTEALGTLSRVWGNKQNRHEKGVGSGLIAARIGERDVMLVTLPVYSNERGNGKGVLHLWLTDNTHIVDIGPVSGEDDVAASSLFYKSGNNNEELIALYEKKGGGQPSPGVASVLLTAQLKRVKEVLATWREVDKRVSKLCASPGTAKGTSTGTACSTVRLTDGLVGFLSGKFSGNTWRDEYLGVNATVTKGVASGPVDGVTFGGVGAGAQWPVGKQGQNQLYHFANSVFTLVATVSIHEAPESGSVPLLGARMNDDKSTVLLGLSYNNEKKWELLSRGGKTKEHSSTWEPEKTYQVAIVLQNGNQGSAYIDGQHVGNAQFELKNTGSKGISYFYIGGDGGSTGSQEVSVTVTNVMLYNRPLSAAEIGVLNANKPTIPKILHSKTVAAGATGEDAARKIRAHGNGCTVCGFGLVPLLLLLGLWGFAAL
ncbi:putative trans-sialidase, Group V [Trypanosoma cruzi]|nr:putative trans-sialidase, Group V [Trypanosoma cruzi]